MNVIKMQIDTLKVVYLGSRVVGSVNFEVGGNLKLLICIGERSEILILEVIPNVINTRHARTYVGYCRSEMQHNNAYGLVILEPIGLLHFLNLLGDGVSRNSGCSRRRRCLESIWVNRIMLSFIDNWLESLGLKVGGYSICL